MTLDELSETVGRLQPGHGARVPYELYAQLFPPGEPDENARGVAYEFARERGLQIDNRRDDQAVWFFRPAAAEENTEDLVVEVRELRRPS